MINKTKTKMAHHEVSVQSPPPTKRKCMYICRVAVIFQVTIALDIFILPISPLKNVSLRRNRNIVFFSNTTKIRKQYLKKKYFYEISTSIFYHSIGVPEEKTF